MKNSYQECEHESQRIKGMQPDFRNKEGKEFFLSDKLECKKCQTPWYIVINEDLEKLKKRMKYCIFEKDSGRKEGIIKE